MKWLFGILLLTSIGFFVLMKWGGVGHGDSKGLKPQPPLNIEKIVLLPASYSAASAVHTDEKLESACMEWGSFSGSDLTRATAAISALNLGNLTQRQVEHAIGYWVYLPPLRNNAEVERKVATIKKLGLEEYFVVQDTGKWQNAISLGVFKTEETANKFRDSLIANGLSSAKVGERAGKRLFTVFVLKAPDADTLAKMTLLQKDFQGSELKAATCQ